MTTRSALEGRCKPGFDALHSDLNSNAAPSNCHGHYGERSRNQLLLVTPGTETTSSVPCTATGSRTGVQPSCAPTRACSSTNPGDGFGQLNRKEPRVDDAIRKRGSLDGRNFTSSTRAVIRNPLDSDNSAQRSL